MSENDENELNLQEIAFIRSKLVASEKNHRIDDLVTYLLSLDNQSFMYELENNLSKINLSEAFSVSDFYRASMTTPNQMNLPNYGTLKAQEMMSLSPTQFIQKSEFLNENVSKESEVYVTFLVSSYRLPFGIGSGPSLEFLQSLLLCNDSDVFSTPLIRNYINFKWNRAQWLLKTHSILYFIFLIFLLFNILITKDYITLIGLTFLNAGDLVYELLQMRHNFFEYAKSKTNWLDLLRIILTFYHVINNEYINFFSDEYVTVIMLVSFLRGILYFKMFKQTRYIIKMIEEIFRDSFFFGVIITYMLLALATLFHFARSGSSTYFDSFIKVYMMMYGEFHFDEDSMYDWICFFLISLALPLIMFNLLVAIMGDTYKNAYESMVEMDFKAMTQMILETEIIQSNFFNGDDQRFYLQKCTEGSQVEEDISGRLKNKIQGCIKDITDLTNVLEKYSDKSESKLLLKIKETREMKNKLMSELKTSLISGKLEVLGMLEPDF